jgi:hypothetical protein
MHGIYNTSFISGKLISKHVHTAQRTGATILIFSPAAPTSMSFRRRGRDFHIVCFAALFEFKLSHIVPSVPQPGVYNAEEMTIP